MVAKKSEKEVYIFGALISTKNSKLKIARVKVTGNANINYSDVIVILAYKPTITFRFTLWLLSVINTSIKD